MKKLLLFILLLPFFASAQWTNGTIQREASTGRIRYIQGSNLDSLVRIQLNSLSNLDMLRYNAATGKFIPRTPAQVLNDISAIRNGTSQQTSANFNIDGSGKVGTTFTFPNTTSSSVGVIYKDTTAYIHNFAPVGSIARVGSPSYNQSDNLWVGKYNGNFLIDTIGGFKFGGINVGSSTISVAGTYNLRNIKHGYAYYTSIFGSNNAFLDTLGHHLYIFGTSNLGQDLSATDDIIMGDGNVNNTTGANNNVLIGKHIGHTSTATVSHNVVAGFHAGHDLSGSYNVFLGDSSAYFESGSYKLNIGVRPTHWRGLIRGDFSDSTLYISSLVAGSDSTEQIAQTKWVKQRLASYAPSSGSIAYIQNQNGSNLAAQTAKFWVSDTIKTSGKVLANNDIISRSGGSSAIRLTSGGANYAIIQDADAFNRIWFEKTGSYRTILDIPSSGNLAVRDHSSNRIMNLTEAGVMTIDNLGTGAVQATAGVLSVVSDSGVKDTHGKIKGSALSIIDNLDAGQLWNYNAKAGMGKNAESVLQFGLLADQVHAKGGELAEQLAPTQGTYKDGKFIPDIIDGKPKYGLNDRALLSLQIQAFQEYVKKTDARISALEKRIGILEKK